MKKRLGILFLVILLLQIAGTYVYFIARLTGIRSEMREQLKHKPDEELTRLILSLSEYNSARIDDHEVKVNGKMYDIARITLENDKVWIYALHDEAEDNLLSFLQEVVKRTSKDKKPVPASLIHLLSLQFVIIDNSFTARCLKPVEHFTPYCVFANPINKGMEAPPPRSFPSLSTS